MTICEAGDVAIVPFPFTDIAIAKPRPALALSAAEANEANGATLFAMITTAQRSRWPSDIPLSDRGSGRIVSGIACAPETVHLG